MSDDAYRFAHHLSEYRLYRSTGKVLSWIRHARTMDIAILAEKVRESLENDPPPVAPALYFLAVGNTDREAILVPIHADICTQPGNGVAPACLAEEARGAVRQAFGLAAAFLRNSFSWNMECVLPANEGVNLTIDGSSLGLAAALAFVQRACGLQLEKPVVVTGKLDANGVVIGVGCLEQKIRAALEELGDHPGVVLFPPNGTRSLDPRLQPVQRFQEAISLLWGTNVRVDPLLQSIEELIAQVDESDDYEGNLRRLELWLGQKEHRNLQPADIIRLRVRVMMQLRHLGRTEDAETIRHELQKARHAYERYYLDPEHIQEIEVQLLATTLDSFPDRWFRTAIDNHLKDRMLSWQNRIRLQGILATYESMVGNGREAVRLREDNCSIHRQRSDLQEDLPFTLCHFAWECARAGLSEKFWQTVRELEQETGKLVAEKAARQRRYNYHAVAAGCVRLGEESKLADFIEDSSRAIPGLDGNFRAWCLSDEPVLRHPEISTLRALVRMYRRLGRPEDALRLSSRFEPQRREHDLTQFLFWVCRIETELAAWESGVRQPERLREIPDVLSLCHKPAARFYPDLLDFCLEFDGSPDSIRKLETEIDKLYY